MKALANVLKLTINLPAPSSIQVSRKIKDNSAIYTQITENIFISGYQCANDEEFLRQKNITNIINCASENNKNRQSIQFPHIRYLMIPLCDNPGSEIMQSFYLTIDFIETVVEGNILIHCAEGISRGPALVASYLMWKNKISKEEAMTILKTKRDCVDINLGFLIQLSIWEQYIFSNNIQLFQLKENGTILFLAQKEFDSLIEGKMVESLLGIKLNRNLYIINLMQRNDIINLDKYVYYLKNYDDTINKIESLDLDNEIMPFNTKVIMEKIGEVMTLSQ